MAEEKVRIDEKEKIAKSLFQTNLSNDEIAKHTGLTVKEIAALRNKR
jgi:transposase